MSTDHTVDNRGGYTDRVAPSALPPGWIEIEPHAPAPAIDRSWIPEFEHDHANCKVHGNELVVGTLVVEAHDDRVLIVEDEFRSGYECLKCKGRGRVQCANCEGTGRSRIVVDGNCSHCQGHGTLTCPKCEGKTVEEGGLIVPDVAKRRPTTGLIVSVGYKVRDKGIFTAGQSVIFPSFVGNVYDLGTGILDANDQEIDIVVRVMRESEVISKCRGHLELRRVKRAVAHATE